MANHLSQLGNGGEERDFFPVVDDALRAEVLGVEGMNESTRERVRQAIKDGFNRDLQNPSESFNEFIVNVSVEDLAELGLIDMEIHNDIMRAFDVDFSINDDEDNIIDIVPEDSIDLL